MEVKSREDVLAERKLRKSAKKSKKKNSTNEQAGGPSLENTSKVNELSKTIEHLQISETKDVKPVSEDVSSREDKHAICVSSSSCNAPDHISSVGNVRSKKMKNVKIPETESSSTVSKIFLPNVNEWITSSTSSFKVSETNAIDEEEKSVRPISKSDEKANDIKNESQPTDVTKSKAQLKAERRAIQVRV